MDTQAVWIDSTVMQTVTRHTVVALLTAIVIFGLAPRIIEETQHLWAPFETGRTATMSQDGRTLRVHIATTVHRRYRAVFRSRLITPAGRWFDIREHGSLTGRIGTFELTRVYKLPENYQPGEWCYLAEYEVVYNEVNTVYGSYEPACMDVK